MSKRLVKNRISLGMWCGIFASFLYASVAIFFLWNNQVNKSPLELNEIGDYLAGVFSPLAFLWLVIGYLMQNIELTESRKEKQKAEREKLISSQPIIEFSNCEIALNIVDDKWGKSGLLSFNISNYGEPATDLSLRVKGCFDGYSYFQVFKSGDNKMDSIINLTEIGPRPSFKIEISYIDAFKEIRTLKYSVNISFQNERDSPFECEVHYHPDLQSYSSDNWFFYDVSVHLLEDQWL